MTLDTNTPPVAAPEPSAPTTAFVAWWLTLLPVSVAWVSFAGAYGGDEAEESEGAGQVRHGALS